MHRRAATLLATGIVCLAPAIVHAGGVRIVSQDGFASARGEAFVATADNPSAIYYNPAGITQLEGTQTRNGLYVISYHPKFRPPSGAPNEDQTYYVKDNVAAIPQLFITHTPKDWPATFGLGVYAPFGLGLNWQQDTGFRSVATRSALVYLRFNPVAAVKVAPGLSLGAGVSANYARMDFQQGLLATSFPLTNSFRFTGKGWSFGYNLGALWQPHEMVSIGASFRSSTTFDLEGRTKFEQFPLLPRSSRPARAEFEFPMTVAAGISFRPTPKWNVEFNADYTDWTSFGTVTIHHESPPFPLQPDIPVQLQWQESWIYSAGITRYLDHGWHVSGGYVFNENSVPDTFYTPLVADMDRHFFTLGIGQKGKQLDFDVAYQFGYGPARRVAGSTPSSTPGLFTGQTADGTYEWISHAILVTVGLHF